MAYTYYLARFTYPETAQESYEDNILTKLAEAGFDSLLSSGRYRVALFYIRSKLEAIALAKILEEKFPANPAEENEETEIVWQSLVEHSPFDIPEWLNDKKNTNVNSIQLEFSSKYPIDEPLQTITPTPAELQRLAAHRHLIESKEIRAVVLYCGYVEDSKVSPLILRLTQGPIPEDVVSAVKNVAANYLTKYRNSVGFNVGAACCKATKKYEPERHFCSDENCDQPLCSDAFDPDDFIQYVNALPGQTYDQYGGEELENWWEYDGTKPLTELPAEAIVQIREKAETYLCLCLDPSSLKGESQTRLKDHIEATLDWFRSLYSYEKLSKEQVTVDYVINREIKRLSEESY